METANTNSDVIEVVNDDSSTISDKIYTVAEKAAATGLGQYTIRKMDGALRTIEKTAKWSLPQIPEGLLNFFFQCVKNIVKPKKLINRRRR